MRANSLPASKPKSFILPYKDRLKFWIRHNKALQKYWGRPVLEKNFPPRKMLHLQADGLRHLKNEQRSQGANLGFLLSVSFKSKLCWFSIFVHHINSFVLDILKIPFLTTTINPILRLKQVKSFFHHLPFARFNAYGNLSKPIPVIIK